MKNKRTINTIQFYDGVFDDFPKSSDHFPKTFQSCSEGQTNVPENFRRYLKTTEDCRRLSRKTRRCFDDTPTNLSTRDKLDISEIIDIFTCEDIISSHVRISYRFYRFVTMRYTTDFYILIKTHFYIVFDALTTHNIIKIITLCEHGCTFV